MFPTELGLPDYWDRRYDPLWAAIQDADLPICCHIGLNTQLEGLAKRDPTPQKGIFVPMTGLSTGEALGMWVLTGVLERFPRLKVVFVEPGVGWVSWWLYLVDDMTTRQGYEYPGLKHLPSHYFRQSVYLTFIDEPDVVRHAHDRLGIENVMWSSDYPHPVSSWPNSKHISEALMADASDTDRELVLSGNGKPVWHLWSSPRSPGLSDQRCHRPPQRRRPSTLTGPPLVPIQDLHSIEKRRAVGSDNSNFILCRCQCSGTFFLGGQTRAPVDSGTSRHGSDKPEHLGTIVRGAPIPVTQAEPAFSRGNNARVRSPWAIGAPNGLSLFARSTST